MPERERKTGGRSRGGMAGGPGEQAERGAHGAFSQDGERSSDADAGDESGAGDGEATSAAEDDDEVERARARRRAGRALDETRKTRRTPR